MIIEEVYPVKCNACPVKFEVRKYFTREGAYFTGVIEEV
jgi:hypothetical protein